jgi:hypothetical protein
MQGYRLKAILRKHFQWEASYSRQQLFQCIRIGKEHIGDKEFKHILHGNIALDPAVLVCEAIVSGGLAIVDTVKKRGDCGLVVDYGTTWPHGIKCWN